MIFIMLVAVFVAETDISQRGGEMIGSIKESFKRESIPISDNTGETVIPFQRFIRNPV
jgi:hypothetical protein